MAAVNIINTRLQFNIPAAMPDFTAADATDGALIDYMGKEDGRILLMLKNTTASAGSCVIKAGNALQGCEDLQVALEADGTHMITVESGRYVNAYGANKGKLQVTGNVAVAAIELP